ncbi:hypothetical protein KKF34_17700 [Myxococcota bacterium]|nr:hypothetical protein [Myxococcota bacterium]MBU1382192.1 hypothetical protein [Myxococcota bacterium]MBU1498718.1 hypothetical protein [Myxococcota bacterium]
MKILILSIVAVLAVSCSDPKFIRGTKIPDNKQNRELIEVVEKYRKTLMKMDASGLIAMAHPDYYQPAVTTEDIPYDYKGLKEALPKRFKLTRNIRFEMQYRKINWKDTETASVEIFIDASYLIKVGTEEQWKKKSDYWKIDLKKHEGVWKIIAGM